MTRKYLWLLGIFVLAFAGATLSYYALREQTVVIDTFTSAPRPPKIHPDYAGTTIPPNIAPLNFRIEEPGGKYCVRIRSTRGPEIEIVSGSPNIEIPLHAWRHLLRANGGEKLLTFVYAMGPDAKWTKYEGIENRIARDELDAYIAYRMLKPNFNYWRSIGIYQRNLTNWDESLILHGDSFKHGCVNCHTFLNNHPQKMFVGTRSPDYGSGTLFVHNGQVDKIGAKWGYAAWHPSGRIVVYAVMKVRQFFHQAGMEIRDVLDLDSALLYYDLDKQELKSPTAILDKDRLETYPTWSPDGRHLYFCSAAIPWKDRDKVPPENYDRVRYELRRATYDIDTDQWGEPETVLSIPHLSILMPRISPDGRFLLFSVCDYGCFPIHRQSSDLYMLDLNSHKYRRLPINSDEYAESWHCWSSNGRWIAFSSRRMGGTFTRLYISHMDASGNAHKPFILPQKDPAFYDSFLKAYSVPEFITGPVRVNRRALARAARSESTIQPADPLVTGATPKPIRTGASEPYRRGPR